MRGLQGPLPTILRIAPIRVIEKRRGKAIGKGPAKEAPMGARAVYIANCHGRMERGARVFLLRNNATVMKSNGEYFAYAMGIAENTTLKE